MGMKKYRINVLAIQETRWTGKGITDTKIHTILQSGNDSKHEFGVAFIVEKKIKDNILNLKSINERICTLRLRTKFFKLSIINVDAETEDKRELVTVSIIN